MALRLGALEDALLKGGGDARLAAAAAEEVADYKYQMAVLKNDLSVVKFLLVVTAIGNLLLTLTVMASR